MKVTIEENKKENEHGLGYYIPLAQYQNLGTHDPHRLQMAKIKKQEFQHYDGFIEYKDMESAIWGSIYYGAAEYVNTRMNLAYRFYNGALHMTYKVDEV